MIASLFMIQWMYPILNGRSSYNQAPLFNLGSFGAIVHNFLQLAVLLTATLTIILARSRQSSRVALIGASSLMIPSIIVAIYHANLAVTMQLFSTFIILIASASWGIPRVELISYLRGLMRATSSATLLLTVISPAWAFVPDIHFDRSFFGFDTRLTGIATNPAYLAILACIHLCFEVYAVKKTRWTQFFTVLSVLIILWSQGRTGLLFLLLFSILWFFTRHNVSFKISRTISFTMVLLLLVTPIILLELAPAGLESATSSRSIVWKLSIQSITEKPIFGGGPDLFQNGYLHGAFSNAHNQLLETLAIYGFIGLIGMLGFLWVVLGGTITIANRSHQFIGLSLFLVLLAQIPFGTPLRLLGLNFNLVAIALIMMILASSSHEITLQKARYR